MVQSIHAVLRNALECAVREETIPRNVAKLVKVTTPNYKVNRGLTTAQARTVLRVAAGHRLYALYVLGLFLGLRRGELLGLRWVDVDLDGQKLEVVQALQRVGGRLRFVKRKTGDSFGSYCRSAGVSLDCPVIARALQGMARIRPRGFNRAVSARRV
jgi:integrase